MESGKRIVSKQVAFFVAVAATLLAGEIASAEPFCDRFYFYRPQLAAQQIVAAAEQVPGYKVNPAPAYTPAAQSAIDGNWLRRLNDTALERVHACRVPARFMQAKLGRRPVCNSNSSKGLCAQATKETLNRMKIPMPNGNAADQQGFLNNPKYFEKIAEQKVYRGHPAGGRQIDQSLCNNGDPGIVCLYTTTRHNYGHIEIKSSKNRFCSDFCSTHASNLNKKGAFTLVGVYRIKPQ